MSILGGKTLSLFAFFLALTLTATVVVLPAGAADDPPLPAPTVYLMAVPQGEYILVTWTPVPTDEVYGVYGMKLTRAVYSDGYMDFEVIAALSPEDAFFLDEHALPGVGYRYQLDILSDVDHPNYSFWGSTAIYIRTDAVGPSVPLDLTGSAGGSQANLTWTEPADDGGGSVYNYTVYMGSNATDLQPLMNVRDQDYRLNGGCVVHNLSDGVEYFFAVQAVNPVGVSNLSDVVVVKPMPSPRLTVECDDLGSGDFDIFVHWEPPESGSGTLVGYVLYVEGISFNTTTFEYGLEDRNYTYELRGAFGEFFRFRVAALYDDGNLSFSNQEELQFGMWEGVGFIGLSKILPVLVAFTLALALIALIWRLDRRGR